MVLFSYHGNLIIHTMVNNVQYMREKSVYNQYGSEITKLKDKRYDTIVVIGVVQCFYAKSHLFN